MALATSRIFVRNLPVNLTEQDFQSHFSQQRAVTDARLIGHRRIGYVGYKTPEEAEAAVKYFNKSFIRMSKLHVELARPASESSPHPTRARHDQNDNANLTVVSQPREENSLKRKRPSPPPKEDNPKLQEFLKVMQRPSQIKSWVNEEADQSHAAAQEQVPQVTAAEQEGDSDDEYQAITKKSKRRDSPKPHDSREVSEEPLEFGKSTNFVTSNGEQPQNDSDWLQSRTGHLLGLEKDDDKDDKIEPIQEASEDEITKTGIEAESHRLVDEAEHEAELVEDQTVIDVRKSKRLFLRNLPFTITEGALVDEFSAYGQVEEAHVPMNNITGSAKGFAYVLFADEDSAVEAFKHTDGKVFQGRLIHVLPATAKREAKLDEFALSKLPLKKQKAIKRKQESNVSTFNWNSLYMNPDAVMSSIASRLGVEKSSLLDPTSTDAAVKQTQAETHIIQETKKYFAENGVDLEAFRTKKRGDTAILVKNFPYGTKIEELRSLFEEYGRIIRLLMPPSGTIAIIEFAVAPDARAAFKGLAYRKIKDSILFLEPAPQDLFTGAPKPSSIITSTSDGAVQPKLSATDLLRSEVEPEAIDTTTLHIRNLNFTTTTEKLNQIFAPIDGFVSAVVRTKYDPKKNETLSRGYGFLEFRTKQQALAALSAMNNYTLEGHKLEIKVSQKTLDAAEERRKEAKANTQATRRTKIIIKNLAFEASKKDIRELVKQYGSIRSVRLPKKFDSTLRGFAFVEFSTPLEAQQACDALRHSHYHGRRLVIEFAEAEAEDAEAQLEQMAAKVNSQVSKLTAQKLVGTGRRKFNVSGEEPDS